MRKRLTKEQAERLLTILKADPNISTTALSARFPVTRQAIARFKLKHGIKETSK